MISNTYDNIRPLKGIPMFDDVIRALENNIPAKDDECLFTRWIKRKDDNDQFNHILVLQRNEMKAVIKILKNLRNQIQEEQVPTKQSEQILMLMDVLSQCLFQYDEKGKPIFENMLPIKH